MACEPLNQLQNRMMTGDGGPALATRKAQYNTYEPEELRIHKAKHTTWRCCCVYSVCLPLQPPLLLAPLGYCIFFVLRMWCLGVCCDG